MPSAIDIRPFTLADAEAVSALHKAVWWPARSMESWRWLLSNPAHPADTPFGWVAASADGPQAFAGNLVQTLWRGGDAWRVATGYSLVVSANARGAARPLIRAVANQPGMAAVHTLNANAQAARLYRRMGFEAFPAGTSDVKLTWIVDPAAALLGRLTREIAVRRNYRGVLGNERLLNARLGRRLTRFERGVEPLEDVSDDGPLGAFWARMKGQGRAVVDRSPATIRWRLANPDATTPPVVLAWRRDGAITGWLLAQVSKGSEIEVPILDVIDLAVLDDDPEAIQALMTTVLKGARSIGAAKVRLQVVSPATLAALGTLATRARREGGWGHGYVQFAAGQADDMRREWSPTPFDGDHGVCLRHPPIAR